MSGVDAAVGAGPIAMTPAQRAHRRSVLFLRWLRRIHLWVGLWGAALGLVFGVTGLLMNHRAVLKIPVEKMTQQQTQLALPDTAEPPFDSAEGLAEWLRRELKIEGDAGRVRTEPARPVAWGDRTLRQPARWSVDFAGPGRQVRAEYWVGNRFVKVESLDATPLGLLMRLHTASGVSAFWVLLADTIAGGMVLLSLTGVLLWSRLHPLRLSTLGLSLGALAATVGYLLAAT
jgi:hypothetical protein